jgi:N-acetylglucosaminyldiphosphoundecaprenol N-acetyl-beta-D-mannosaminyltransferase
MIYKKKIIKYTEDILGFDVSNMDSIVLTEEVYKKSIISHSKKWIACMNPHSFAISIDDKSFRNALKSADWLIPDGVGIVYASKLLGGNIKKRITGYEIFYLLSKKLNFNLSSKVFFLGSSNSVLKKIRIKMKSDFPNILVDYYSPPFRDKFDAKENLFILKRINTFSPDVLWVGMTAPKQEKWIYNNIKHLNIGLAVGIGAVFDFYSGEKKRADPLIQYFGLEWLFRLYNEPKRLWKRTFISSFIFLGKLLYQFFCKCFFDKRS